ncbi:MAG: 1-acyl-sn-glycerol-3-phosphate acyltransferase [Zetaproteobacteria bacterium]|nr:1-acyl-sn-glycerol-3-phosphate acyltransferase [Zetaproteobacteria bacterium]
MLLIRSLIFNALFFVITPLYSVLLLLFRPFGLRASWLWAKAWPTTVWFLARVICGIRLQIEGQEHFPQEACVVMAKHQSAFETLSMPALIPPYVWILKRELFYIPIFGWALWAIDAIAIRRGNPREALKQVIDQGRKFLAEGRWVVIFPEGTRSAAGETGEYKPGGVILAQKAGAGILPMAHNAGVYWPKRGFIKRPGTIRIRFLPYISSEEVSAMRRNDLLAKLEADIERNTRELGG